MWWQVYANSTPRSNTLTMQVYQGWAASGQLLCNGQACPSLRVSVPGDAMSLPPIGYTTSVALSVSITLQGGGSLVLQAAPGLAFSPSQTFTVDCPPPQLCSVAAAFSAAWQLPGLSSYVQSDSAANIYIQPLPGIFQIHCSGYWPQAGYNVLVNATSGLQIGVTRYTTATATAGLVLDAPGLLHPVQAGQFRLTAAFGGLAYTAGVLVLNSSLLLYTVSIALPGDWTVPVNTQLPLAPVLAADANPGWTTSDAVARVVLSYASSDPGVIAVPGSARTATLLSDFYQAVTVTTTIMACGPLAAQAFPTVVSPHILAAQDGGLDVGPVNGLPISPQAVRAVFNVPVYMYASQPLRSYTVDIRFPVGTLQPLSCSPGALPDSQCELLPECGPGCYQAVGSYLDSSLTGRVLVATVSFQALLDSLSSIQLDSPESRVYTQVITGQARNFTVKLGVGGQLVTPSSPGVGSSRRRLLQAQVWGDTEGVGRFSSLSVQFLEEYMVYSQYTGDQRICVSVCQWITNITAWQRRMLNPVSDPHLPPTPPTLISRLFLLHVLVAKYHFLSDWNFTSNSSGLALYAQLTDLNGNLNPPGARVALTLQSPANTGLAFDVSAGSLATTPISHTLYADPVVPLTITEYTTDAQGLRSADRSFTFYPTGPFAFVAIQGAQYVPPPVVIVQTPGPPPNCTHLCLDVQRFEGAFPLDLAQLEGLVWSTEFVLGPPTLELLDQAGPVTNPPANVSLPAPVTPLATQVASDGLYTVSEAPVGQAFLVEYTPPDNTGGGIFVLSGVGPAVSIYAVAGHNTTISLTMTPGIHTLVVRPYDTLNRSSPLASVQVQGPVPALTGILLAPACTWLIRWSVLGGQDDACTAQVYAIYTLGPPSVIAKGACTPDGCTGRYGNLTATAAIDGYTPFEVTIVASTQLLGVGQRAPWAVLADLYSPATGRFINQAAITRQVYSLVTVYPSGVISVSPRYIQALRPGTAAVYLGGQALAFNVSVTGLQPTTLELLAFAGNTTVVLGSEVNCTLAGWNWAANTSGTLLVYAWYAGNYRVQLTPADAVSLAVDRQISVAKLSFGWQLTVSAYAPGAPASPVVNASFQGAVGSLLAAILPIQPPLSLYVCCDLVSPPAAHAIRTH